MITGDTIVAMSSPGGPAARCVIRMSGPDSHRLARELAADAELRAGGASIARIWPGVRGWVYCFIGPRSYSGEDSIEFHVPGSPVVVRMILDELARRGARAAEPGEFTARAYLNGRMDLTQAEGVAATISASSGRQARAARQLLAGELARRLAPIMEQIASALALIEVGIDFSDEDVSFLSTRQVEEHCRSAESALAKLLAESARFERLSHEPRIVLAGRPNAGKSTLLNALARSERAIVSDVAGTTRDAIWAHIQLPRGIAMLVDVAGLEADPLDDLEAPAAGSGGLSVDAAGDGTAESPRESIDRQMREQALRESATADLLVLVRSCGDLRPMLELPRPPDLIVRTMADLTPGALLKAAKEAGAEIHVSAFSQFGMPALRQALDALAFGADAAEDSLALNARHVRAIEIARVALGRAGESASAGAELVALDLREALDALGDVLGKMSADDLLGRVFSQFCIGK